MLSNLIVRNFAIIEDIEVSFESGLSVITGETGAGKSIIIDALSLLLGERSAFNKIRHGAKQAFIEGTFYIVQDENIETINELVPGLIEEDRLLIVTRVLDEAGRSRLSMNGRTTTLTISKQIMGTLIDIHSQHENIALLDEKNHLHYLDAFVDPELYQRFQTSYLAYLTAVEDFSALQATLITESEREFIEFQIKEIKDADIKVGELAELENIANQLKNLDKIAHSKDKLTSLLTSDHGALNNLYLAGKEFAALGEDYEVIATALNDAYYELDEKVNAAFSKIEELFSETQSIDQVMTRIYLIRKIIRKYHHSEIEALAALKTMESQVSAAANHQIWLNEAEAQVKKLHADAQNVAEELSIARQEAAKTLEREVNAELADLALNNATFKVNFGSKDLAKTGIDQVAFYLAANVGSSYLPLKNAISGGEASRLMLALKIVFKTLGSAETLIFDEVDSGVSGRIASIVGKKMLSVSESVQVIAITHLAQVAAYASNHYYVEKNIINETTKASINLLDVDETIVALAKLLSGDEVSETTLALAKELKANAI